MISRIITTKGAHFTEAEATALQALRERYHTGQGLFTDREIARLRFLRWLVQSPGWNRALDQPCSAIAGSIVRKEAGPWMPGSTS
jgi:hypothetical protein